VYYLDPPCISAYYHLGYGLGYTRAIFRKVNNVNELTQFILVGRTMPTSNSDCPVRASLTRAADPVVPEHLELAFAQSFGRATQ